MDDGSVSPGSAKSTSNDARHRFEVETDNATPRDCDRVSNLSHINQNRRDGIERQHSTARGGLSRPHRYGRRQQPRTDSDERSRQTGNVTEGSNNERGEESDEQNVTEKEKRTRNTRTVRRARLKLKTKAHLRISSLNVKGRSLTTTNGSKGEKINEIPNLMRNNKVNILAIHESHYTEDYVAEIVQRFGDTIHIEYSRPIGRSASKAEGVALIFYKPTTNVSGITKVEIIPGRAMVVSTPWHDNDTLKIMVGYAPNDENESKAYWEACDTFFAANPTWKPDIACFDANRVEAAIDRLPAHEDRADVVLAMQAFLRTCDLIDGWRTENPDKIAFTFSQGTSCPSQSRIDRIYIKKCCYARSRSWDIESASPDGIKSDHKRVSCEMTTANAPEQGTGRYTVPPYIAKTAPMKKRVNETGTMLMKDMLASSKENRTRERNPQTLWGTWKVSRTKEMRQEAKQRIPKAKKKMAELNEELDLVTNNEDLVDEVKQQRTAEIEKKITDLGEEVWQDKKASAKANREILGEANSKYYTRLIKGDKPRDPIVSFKIPNTNPPRFQRNPKEMANMLNSYHDDLQSKDINAPATRTRDIETVFQSSVEKLSPEDKTETGKLMTEERIREALLGSKSGSGAGLDGWQYDLYQHWDKEWRKTIGTNKEASTFNIVRTLCVLYNDIELYGLIEGSTFADGWLCPLYKKADRTEMANYRPITLLNTDYKIMTKAMAVMLAERAPQLIHSDQAGFVKGRSIIDQIKLAKSIIYHADATEHDGMIVLLDQEKAYDKILHDYLWRVMERHDLAPSFIETTRQLYTNATTKVIINGEMSAGFKVTRGVRQGDPLSCLLFNLAIEPLASMLRASALEGYRLPGAVERLIVTLFADDTTIYLAASDRFSDLQEILNTWCSASGAKFNINKTVVIPIGSVQHRLKLMNDRKTPRMLEPIPESIHIAEDGEGSRSLGSFIGNELDPTTPWSGIMKAAKDVLDKVQRLHPTMSGKRVGIQTYAVSKTQYLSTAEDMPRSVERQFERILMQFFWDQKMARVNKQTVKLPLTEGGQNLVDIKLKNDAVHIVHLANFLGLTGTRPKWALILEDAMREKVLMMYKNVNKHVLANVFVQTWDTNKVALPNDMKRMIKLAKEHGLMADGLAITNEVLREQPIWLHQGWRDDRNRKMNDKYSKCLQTTHHVYTVGEAVDVVEGNAEEIKQCTHPETCQRVAGSLLNALDPKWDPRKNRDAAEHENEGQNNALQVPNTPTPVTSNADMWRIFTAGTELRGRNQFEPRTNINQNEAARSVWITYRTNSFNDPGVGIWLAGSDARNASVVVPENISDEVALLAWGIQRAIEVTLEDVPLTIHTKSKRVIKELTMSLNKNEFNGWYRHSKQERAVLQGVTARLRERTAPTRFQIEKSDRHPGIKGADMLALVAAERYTSGRESDPIPILEKSDSLLTGIPLKGITQKKAYQLLRADLRTEKRRATEANVERIRYALRDLNGKAPTKTQVWHAVRCPDTSKKSQTFRWRGIHEAHATGAFFERMENLAQVATCPQCGVLESLEHILLECNIGSHEIVWSEIRRIWETTGEEWPELTYGTILGCGGGKPVSKGGRETRDGLNRLWRKLISEGARLIWTLRNKRRIEFEDDPTKHQTEPEILNRLYAIIRETASTDFAMLNRSKYGAKALANATVRSTWRKLANIDDKGEEGARAHVGPVGVLVGRGLATFLGSFFPGS